MTARRPALRILLALTLAALLAAVALALALRPSAAPPGGYLSAADYGSGYDRIATWDQPTRDAPFRPGKLSYLAEHGALTFFNPASPSFDIAAHQRIADRLVARARSTGRTLSVFEYFNVSYWFTNNVDGLRPASTTFSQSWLLRSPSGALIPYSLSRRGPPQGYLMDLRSTALRTWIVASVVSWMHAAHYRGVLLDGASPLLPADVRPALAHGTDSLGALLCGAPAASCRALIAWNIGLGTLLSEVRAALRPIGDLTLYNGISPGAAHGPGRNLDLLPSTSGATNENFCYGYLLPGAGATHGYEPLDQDLTIMRRAAQTHKHVIEITNYQDHPSSALAQYCAGAFLLGWQPGSSYYVFHRVYGDITDRSPLSSPELGLRLGDPSIPGHRKQGDVLYRPFEHGAVALNASDHAATFTADRAYARYARGYRTGTVLAGQHVAMPARSALFLLDAPR